jgi:hypothetical protein
VFINKHLHIDKSPHYLTPTHKRVYTLNEKKSLTFVFFSSSSVSYQMQKRNHIERIDKKKNPKKKKMTQEKKSIYLSMVFLYSS